jgi:hypothetical protein
VEPAAKDSHCNISKKDKISLPLPLPQAILQEVEQVRAKNEAQRAQLQRARLEQQQRKQAEDDDALKTFLEMNKTVRRHIQDAVSLEDLRQRIKIIRKLKHTSIESYLQCY